MTSLRFAFLDTPLGFAYLLTIVLAEELKALDTTNSRQRVPQRKQFNEQMSSAVRSDIPLIKLPFMAALLSVPDKLVCICGGSILSPQYVLTACSCFEDSSVKITPENIIVAAGIYNSNLKTTTGQVRSCTKLLRHPKCKVFSMYTYFDYGVVVLQKYLDIRKGSVETMVLPSSSKIPNVMKLGELKASCILSSYDVDVLKKTYVAVGTTIQLMCDENCKENVKKLITRPSPQYEIKLDADSQFCGMNVAHNRTSVFTRGSPLLCDGHFSGMLSTANGARIHHQLFPMIFSRIDVGESWIREVTNLRDDSPTQPSPADTAPPPTPSTSQLNHTITSKEIVCFTLFFFLFYFYFFIWLRHTI